jgi:hypothetical protein
VLLFLAVCIAERERERERDLLTRVCLWSRIIVTDKSKGQLVDCSCWHDDYSQAILALYPKCDISILSSQDISTSGFAVFFSLEEIEKKVKFYHRVSDIIMLCISIAWSYDTFGIMMLNSTTQ